MSFMSALAQSESATQLASRASVAFTALALMIVCNGSKNDSCVSWIINADELIIELISPEQL